MKIYITLCGFILCLCSCNNIDSDISYINKNNWEYRKGFRAADTNFITLSHDTKKWELHHDTVFFKAKPIAIITRYEKKQNFLEIRSVATGRSGEYSKARGSNKEAS
ncbi:MAG: hypothetical protein Q8M29_08455 [Bacteroidota bacterium]|nr:hypothetical protein [Bacteroidota bacterium]